jgi:hypothetical protein
MKQGGQQYGFLLLSNELISVPYHNFLRIVDPRWVWNVPANQIGVLLFEFIFVDHSTE